MPNKRKPDNNTTDIARGFTRTDQRKGACWRGSKIGSRKLTAM